MNPRRANPRRANLRRADLSGADLSQAGLLKANLSGAKAGLAILGGLQKEAKANSLAIVQNISEIFYTRPAVCLLRLNLATFQRLRIPT